MSRRGPRAVDLPRVRSALDRMSAILVAHPEIAERTADFLASNPSTPALEALVPDVPTSQPVKLPPELLARADELIGPLAARPDLTGFGRATRALVIRLAVDRGLAALATDLARPPAAPKARRKADR